MTAAASFPPIPGPVRRFSVAEYHRLVDAGVFDGDERVELLEGWIVAKMTRKPPHDAVLTRYHARRDQAPGSDIPVVLAETTVGVLTVRDIVPR